MKSVSEVRYYPQNFTLNLCVFLAVTFWISRIPRREIFSSHYCKLEWINCGHADWVFDVVVVYSARITQDNATSASLIPVRLLALSPSVPRLGMERGLCEMFGLTLFHPYDVCCDVMNPNRSPVFCFQQINTTRRNCRHMHHKTKQPLIRNYYRRTSTIHNHRHRPVVNSVRTTVN